MIFTVSCFVGMLVLTSRGCVAGELVVVVYSQNLLEMFGQSYSLLIFSSDGLSTLVSDLPVNTSKCGPNLDTQFCVEVFVKFYV